MFFLSVIVKISPILYVPGENDSTPQWNNSHYVVSTPQWKNSYFVVVNRTLE
jgi:hypothetical protein